jgi:hypothetical protein
VRDRGRDARRIRQVGVDDVRDERVRPAAAHVRARLDVDERRDREDDVALRDRQAVDDLVRERELALRSHELERAAGLARARPVQRVGRPGLARLVELLVVSRSARGARDHLGDLRAGLLVAFARLGSGARAETDRADEEQTKSGSRRVPAIHGAMIGTGPCVLHRVTPTSQRISV